MSRTAIILFNLGGPDSAEAVQPFLFNLFNDKAVVRLPQPFRYLLARLISKNRAPVLKEIYAKIGGRSPILENTQAQARALEKVLDNGAKCFIAMRYGHPFAEVTIEKVRQFAPDQIVLLPLYPQFSTTTTASSLDNWQKAAHAAGLNAPATSICCYPTEPGFIRAQADLIRKAFAAAQAHGKPRILFSAHGLPENIIRAGDPYQWQCEQTAQALHRVLQIPDLDGVVCYQSRVGRLKWIGPATDEEIRRAGRDKVPVVVAPIAFVSEHSETLVEIDIEYRHLAGRSGVPFFAYTGAVSTASDFINGLAALARQAMQNRGDCLSGSGARICPGKFSGCRQNRN